MTAAVVIPIYKPSCGTTELIALTQCCRILGRHPLVFVAPEGLSIDHAMRIAEAEGARATVENFPSGCFRSVWTYNALMMSPAFYARFRAFDYILIHQLDAFVFSDELDRFCYQAYDYIGAPWRHQGKLGRSVGNGGFSLRNISAALKVLEAGVLPPLAHAVRWAERKRPREVAHRVVYGRGLIERILASRRYTPPLLWQLLYLNEDGFWGPNCDKLAFFKTAPYDVALPFAFELDCAAAYARNGSRLPFGCHGWPHVEPSFWRPFINRYGYMWEGGQQ